MEQKLYRWVKASDLKIDYRKKYIAKRADDEEFNWFVWAHEDSWYFCPFCGSDNVTDLNE